MTRTETRNKGAKARKTGVNARIAEKEKGKYQEKKLYLQPLWKLGLHFPFYHFYQVNYQTSVGTPDSTDGVGYVGRKAVAGADDAGEESTDGGGEDGDSGVGGEEEEVVLGSPPQNHHFRSRLKDYDWVVMSGTLDSYFESIKNVGR